MTDDEIIAVVTAHKEGKQIQTRFKDGKEGEWADCLQSPIWSFSRFDYRAKPEPPKPREFHIFADGGIVTGGHLLEHCILSCRSNERSIHVREVLEETP